jgi:hypothetical protein
VVNGRRKRVKFYSISEELLQPSEDEGEP